MYVCSRLSRTKEIEEIMFPVFDGARLSRDEDGSSFDL